MSRPVSPDDLFRITGVASPQISPDGTRIVFGVSRPDQETNKTKSDLYLLALDGGEPRQLTHSEKRDGSPRWSPDGTKLSFTSNRSGKSQIWILDLAGGDPCQLTDFKAGLGGALWADNGHAWSADGKWIACVSRGNVEKEELTPANDMNVVDRTFYKWAGGFNPNQPTNIWITPVNGGESKQLTEGDPDDHSMSWSPDSKEIAFVSNRTGDWENNANNDLFAVSIDTGESRRITETPGPEFTPAWSPDGKWIACAACDRGNASKDSPAGNTEIYLVPSEGGAPVKLSGSLDRRSSSPTWSPDSQNIYFSAIDHGRRQIYRVSSEGGKVHEITTGASQISGFSLHSERLVYARNNEHTPNELYSLDLGSGTEKTLTSFNSKWSEQVTTSPSDPFQLSTFDDLTVQGWILKPTGFQSDKKYPALLSIHGGPHGSHGHGFRLSHLALAGAGYAVVYIDPRGSSGYGQAFADGCVQDWGGDDYQDLMIGLDAAIAQNPWIDANRLGVFGGSYGGFMTNWVVTQTNRFKAGVSHASLSNHISFYGTSMYQLLMEYEFGGKPWEAYDAYWERSPMAHVANTRTPLLLTHGEVDHDVPIGQGEEFYIALKKLGVPAEFVRYPREGHGISEPVHVQDFIQRHIDWFDRYLKSD
jgi:dipeptidyl aminopeptidase/acylaminoacyl peptidase